MRLSLGDLEGQGGEGEVYRARNVATGEPWAGETCCKQVHQDAGHDSAHSASRQFEYSDERSVLFGPIDTIVNVEVGHVSRWARRSVA